MKIKQIKYFHRKNNTNQRDACINNRVDISSVLIDFMCIDKKKLMIEGRIKSDIVKNYEVTISSGQSILRPDIGPYAYGGGRDMRVLSATIPLKDHHTYICMVLTSLDGFSANAQLSFGKFIGLSEVLHNSYIVDNKWIVTLVFEGDVAVGIKVTSANLWHHICHEVHLRLELFSKPHPFKLIAWRIVGCAAKRMRTTGRSIWLVSDRPTFAGDNGEALFAWLCRHPQSGIRPIFALSKKSDDWARVSSLGETVDFGSIRYRWLFLNASWVISSSADEPAINAFGRRRIFMKDLYGFKYAFLQHGVIKDDLSSWLNRFNKDIKLFITSAQREWESVTFGNYGYNQDIVKMTGLPRHDELLKSSHYQHPRKIALLMPTWRKYLVEGPANADGVNPAGISFCNSMYYQFYQALIANTRLNEQMQRLGWRMKFVMHPSFLREARTFHPGPVVEVHEHYDYRKAFLDSSLLITDYSSVAFDFALLARPIVYSQFDYVEFRKKHFYSEGYFDYKRDGFGPVCTTLDDTVDAIITALNDAPTMSETYARRMRSFFGEQPVSRCENVTRELMRL